MLAGEGPALRRPISRGVGSGSVARSLWEGCTLEMLGASYPGGPWPCV